MRVMDILPLAEGDDLVHLLYCLDEPFSWRPIPIIGPDVVALETPHLV